MHLHAQGWPETEAEERQIEGMSQPSPKRRRRMAPASTIPDDMLFSEILALLPAKCLARFQSVCKMWRATIRSARFVRRHLELSRAAAGSTTVVFPQEFQPNYLKVGIRHINIYSFQPGKTRVAEHMLSKKFPRAIPNFSLPLHCDGLILIPCIMKRIFVCNPTTGEFVELPPGSRTKAKYERVAFGFDPWSATYKVARHFLRSRSGAITDISGYSFGHEILTLGDGTEAWKWKATADPPYLINAKTPVCLLGFFYWSAARSMVQRNTGAIVSSDVILRFSIRDGTFTVHPNPPGMDFLTTNDRLYELGGKLCYAHSGSFFDVAIWSAEEDGPTLAWSLRCHIKLPIPRHLPVLACSSAEQGKIFLTADSTWCLFKCDLRDGSLESIINVAHGISYHHGNGVKSSTGTHPNCFYMVPFVESLLRIRPS